MKIMRRRKSIRASKRIVLDDYKYIDFRDGYEIYRKGNSWAAQDSDHRCDPFAITYEQARGIEPIDGCDSNAQKGLGKKLMSSKQIRAAADDVDDSDDDDFDRRWDEHFGEPTTEVFTADEFEKWMKEVISFE